jgi:hypothetical protein
LTLAQVKLQDVVNIVVRAAQDDFAGHRGIHPRKLLESADGGVVEVNLAFSFSNFVIHNVADFASRIFPEKVLFRVNSGWEHKA